MIDRESIILAFITTAKRCKNDIGYFFRVTFFLGGGRGEVFLYMEGGTVFGGEFFKII